MLGTVLFMSTACEREKKLNGLSVGQLIPTFELPSLDSASINVSSRDGPYLLNFWATWCPPCRAEMGGLDRVYTAFGSGGLKVLGISVDDDQFLVREYILKEKLSFPILLDGNGQGAVRKVMRVSVYPTSFLVDKAGYIAEIMVGEQDWDSNSLRQRLERLIG
jgi:thiol-disulfide isomerase/thioredoxin